MSSFLFVFSSGLVLQGFLLHVSPTMDYSKYLYVHEYLRLI